MASLCRFRRPGGTSRRQPRPRPFTGQSQVALTSHSGHNSTPNPRTVRLTAKVPASRRHLLRRGGIGSDFVRGDGIDAAADCVPLALPVQCLSCVRPKPRNGRPIRMPGVVDSSGCNVCHPLQRTGEASGTLLLFFGATPADTAAQ